MMGLNQMTRGLFAGVAALVVGFGAVAGEFPDDWYWTGADGKRPAEHTGFEGTKMPGLEVQPWVNGNVTEASMKGKILVIDFWATWCGPCRAAFPHNNEIFHGYADKGVLFLGVCTDNSAETMMSVIKADKPEYPNAYVDGEQVEKDWPIRWYPTYAVVDASGTVRAIGLQPGAVTDVIDALLDESGANEGKARIPRYWLEGDADARARLAKLEAKADTPPALEAEGWENADGLALDQLKGKVVVLSFGATWAGPWLETVEQLNALRETYGEQGLEVIGICSTHEGYALPGIVEKYGIKFPVCIDVENRTNRAYGPNNFPDLYILDRQGHLRIADLKNDNLESAVKALLAEEVAEEPQAEGEADGDGVRAE